MFQTDASIPVPDYAPSDITNVTVRGADGYGQIFHWDVGIDVFGVSNIDFNGTFVVGNNTLAYSTLGTAVRLGGSASLPAVVYNFDGCSFNAVGGGISYGNWVQGVACVNCNFTGCAIGITVPPGIMGTDQLCVSTSQFNCVTGINLATAVENTLVIGSVFIIPQSGVGINALQASLLQIIGCTFTPSSYTEITSQYGIIVTHCQLIGGCIVGNSFYHINGDAITLQPTATGINIQSNAYGGNSSNVVNLGTGNTIGGGSP